MFVIKNEMSNSYYETCVLNSGTSPETCVIYFYPAVQITVNVLELRIHLAVDLKIGFRFWLRMCSCRRDLFTPHYINFRIRAVKLLFLFIPN